MQDRSQRTRRRLVRAGAETFDRGGYASATLGRIAESAGVTKGALYFHFGSKSELAGAVQAQGGAMLREFTELRRRQGVPPLQALIDLSHWLARTLHGDPVVRASCRIGSECAGRVPLVEDFRQLWVGEVLLLLALAEERGELRPGAAGPGTRTLLSAVVCGLEVLAGEGLPLSELLLRTGSLWEALLPVLVPSEELGRYRTSSEPVAAAL